MPAGTPAPLRALLGLQREANGRRKCGGKVDGDERACKKGEYVMCQGLSRIFSNDNSSMHSSGVMAPGISICAQDESLLDN